MSIITHANVMTAVESGFDRMKRFRKSRAMFIKEFVGQYYREHYGIINDEPINLLFNTISIFVPNLVMQAPITKVTTNLLQEKEYAELLGMALDRLHGEIKLKDVLRKWIVDAFFGMSVLKTGICSSSSYYNIENILIDPGQIYTAYVDFDDFVFDSICTDIHDSAFFGNRTRISRQLLLDDKYTNHDLVASLPSAGTAVEKKTSDLTTSQSGKTEMIDINDDVNVIEIWLPDAGKTVLISDPKEYKCKGFLKESDYYGPEDGPYTLLSFTPPVPGNPFPVAPVGIWYDLHIIANKIFKKVMEQSDRQKDILLYDPGHTDEAQDILDAMDGDVIAVTDPTKFQALSIGGQNDKNSQVIGQLQVWFNYMSGNPDQMAGLGSAASATQSEINQSNSTIRLSDMRDILYDRTAEISRREAFYIHNDPLIEIPMTKRVAGGEHIQVILTPEQKEGDYLDYSFTIQAKSMTRLDPMVRTKRIMDFATNVIPSVMTSAQIAMQMGTPFNVAKTLTQLAEEMEILDFVTDWFVDPEYMQKMERMMMMNPPNLGKGAAQGGDMAGTLQQGGYSGQRNIMTPDQEMRQGQQMRAGEAQSRRTNLRTY